MRDIIMAMIGSAALVSLGFMAWNNVEKPKPAPQAMQFIFEIPCADGSRVRYKDTIRLPKEVVCQKAVGE